MTPKKEDAPTEVGADVKDAPEAAAGVDGDQPPVEPTGDAPGGAPDELSKASDGADDAPPADEPPADEPPVEEKPKPRRRRKKAEVEEVDTDGMDHAEYLAYKRKTQALMDVDGEGYVVKYKGMASRVWSCTGCGTNHPVGQFDACQNCGQEFEAATEVPEG